LRLRIGTLDLKIAAIARIHDALLLTGIGAIEQLPRLRMESWID
jgi:predicted nucleic acid-binding protein